MNKPTITVRLVSFFAAATVTSVLVASQFGLAGHYVDASGLLWAGQDASMPVAQTLPASAAKAG